MVAPTTTPSMAPAAVSSLQRQLGSLQVVVSELSVTEDARQTRLKTCPPKGRKALQKRFAFERKLDVDRVTRMKEEADQMRVLAEKGSWNGTVRNLTDTRPPPQVGNVEVKGLEARGGLTDNQYKFLKEVYTKFEEPQKPKPSNAPRAPNLSFFRDQKAAQFNARIESDRRGLLNEKKMLLGRLSNCVDQQGALMRSNMWSGRTSSGSVTGRSDYSIGSRMSGKSSVSNVSRRSGESYASFRGRPDFHITKKPNNVPSLF